MAATYDLTLPTDKDHIRLALGDIDTDNPLLQDETILVKLQSFGYREALAQLAEGLASQYAQMPDSFTDDGMQLTWRERISNWQSLAKSARQIVTPPSGIPPNARRPEISRTVIQASTSTGVMAGFRSD